MWSQKMRLGFPIFSPIFWSTQKRVMKRKCSGVNTNNVSLVSTKPTAGCLHLTVTMALDSEKGRPPLIQHTKSTNSIQLVDQDYPDSPQPAALTVVDRRHRQKLVLELARAFLANGTPSHHVEGQLNAAADALSVQTDIVLMPNVIFVSFSQGTDSHLARMHILKEKVGLSLSSLSATHELYKDIVGGRVSAEEAWKQLRTIRHQRRPYSTPLQRSLIAFVCGASFTLAAVLGSVVDALVAGVQMVSLVWLTHCYRGSPLFGQAVQLSPPHAKTTILGHLC